ncbi:aminoacyl tRNA synthase complex-interacting multifunctional protein 2-like [Liolophura sinensis]|uniref:aminoacyl tRNA synthase complex-interacting multifunctional protein 2-like n=1 Tax=Liolophura sinensis TaxID=3198878 RepID=UPI003158BAF3
MYYLKPYYRSDEIGMTLPDGMYRVPSYHKPPCPVTLPGNSSSGDGSPLSELEQRQEVILQRLAQLQQDVKKLSTEVGIPLVNFSPVCTPGPSTQIQSGVIQDIVVNADPDKPPLSLFIILKLLAQNTKVLTTAHVHSSVTHIEKHLKEIFTNGPRGMRTEYQFAVTLVWKKEELSPSMMVDPHRQSPVVGEANIARYLARLFMPAYDSSDPVQSTLIDTWLDMATHQLLQGNSKEKAAAVRNLNSRLGKNDWLVASSMSLADIVVWSALQQVGLTQDAPANVQKWICSCRNLPEFQLQTLLSH